MHATFIIPCYNCEQYIAETLASAQAQTLQDIEIICVDNNSTDDTRAILNAAAASDHRIKVIEEHRQGAAYARNTALSCAQGDWVFFLDADDYAHPTMFEHMVAAGDANNADVVICRAEFLNNETGDIRFVPDAVSFDWLPEGVTSFVPSEYPDRIFNSFQNWTCKLFRRSFVQDRGITFQTLHGTEDLLFTCRSLVEARCIAVVDQPLWCYRVNNPASMMATSDAYPLDFYQAFLALRDSLEEHKTWKLYHASFVNWAMESIVANLSVTRSFAGFSQIVETMRRGGAYAP